MATGNRPLVGDTSSDKQRMLGAILAAMRSHELQSDQLLPAIVKSFDRASNVAVVQPLIRWIDVNRGQHSRHPLTSINVLSLGGGGFHISFPLQAGDLGWVLASDRDISLFKQSLEEAAPNSGRLHSFEDAWFVPDVFRKYTINAEDSAAMVIQSVDGNTRISITDGQVKITAPTKVIVDTPLAQFTHDVIINENLTVNGNADIDQNLNVDGNETIGGSETVAGGSTIGGGLNANGGLHAASGQPCDLPNGTTVGGVNVSGHGHISSSPGNRTSGGMIS